MQAGPLERATVHHEYHGQMTLPLQGQDLPCQQLPLAGSR